MLIRSNPKPLTVLFNGLFFALLCLTLAQSLAAQVSYTPDKIQSPRPTGWIVDTTGHVPEATMIAIDILGDEIYEKTKTEIAVVVTDTTDGKDPRQFATELMNQWGVGGGFKNNGTLFFVALEDRAAEIVLGDGVDHDQNVREAQNIMDHFLIPAFRRNDLGGGLYETTRAIATRIYDVATLKAPVDLPSSGESMPEFARSESRPDDKDKTEEEKAEQRKSIQLLLSQHNEENRVRGIIEPATLNGRNQGARRDVVPARGGGGRRGMGPLPLLLGLGGLGIGGYFISRRYYRYRHRDCIDCFNEMVFLTEEQDDQFLDPPERIEEKIGSADYDVWACLECESVQKFRHGSWFTRYTKCPKCRYQTASKIKRTLVPATQYNGGRVEVHESCCNCAYEHTYTYRTAPLPKPSKSRGSGSGGFSSGGFSIGRGGRVGGGFSGSSSRSSGFGGGRSSGRGASGRW